MCRIISQSALEQRAYWINEIRHLSGNFAGDALRLQRELEDEIREHGTQRLIDHLRLCGNIPEEYSHDSSEEKLYSKYTDCLIAFGFRALGINCVVLEERADSADVLGTATEYSFVADAKAFRVSRTAKNQKDFKVEALNGWRGVHNYAMVVCPIYQLPTRASQIYKSATSRNVCVFTYSHLSLLVAYAQLENSNAMSLLTQIFQTIDAMPTSNNAVTYWSRLNGIILRFDPRIRALWEVEERAALEATNAAKSEGIAYLNSERQRINELTREEAIEELLSANKIESKADTINGVVDTGLFRVL